MHYAAIFVQLNPVIYVKPRIRLHEWKVRVCGDVI